MIRFIVDIRLGVKSIVYLWLSKSCSGSVDIEMF